MAASRAQAISRRFLRQLGSQILFVAPAVVILAAGFIFAYQFVRPAPPSSVVMATGAEDGAYHALGKLYAERFREEGFDLVLKPTAGSVENLKLLSDEKAGVPVAFLQSGIGRPEERPELRSLGSLYFEPIWVFVRAGKAPRRLTELAGKRIAVGPEGSGNRAVALPLLEANGITAETAQLLDLSIPDSVEALKSGSIDAAIIVGAATSRTVRSVIGLPAIPRRIDCFDISTIQGSETVASMVVCEDGRMKKSEYKKFRVRGRPSGTPNSQRPTPDSRSRDREPRIPSPESPTVEMRSGSDDFAAMREVVHRRYRKMLEEGGPFPELILIDGGRGQLSAAYEALEGIGLGNLVAVGIAKKEEVIFTRDRPEPIVLPEHDPALLLTQRIRDEAHRFALTFHRKARSMRDLRSELDAVPGIGPRRRRALLTAFGSLAGVRRATREELATVVGPKAAATVIDYFARSA